MKNKKMLNKPKSVFLLVIFAFKQKKYKKTDHLFAITGILFVIAEKKDVQSIENQPKN
jgi:hypothetical protein